MLFLLFFFLMFQGDKGSGLLDTIWNALPNVARKSQHKRGHNRKHKTRCPDSIDIYVIDQIIKLRTHLRASSKKLKVKFHLPFLNAFSALQCKDYVG